MITIRVVERAHFKEKELFFSLLTASFLKKIQPKLWRIIMVELAKPKSNILIF